VDVAGLEASAASYVHGAHQPPLLETTIGRSLLQTTERHPDAPALISLHQGVRMNYTELLAGAQRCARALLAVGVARGDRVGVWAGNCAEWALLQYASAMVGAILVSLNPAFKAAELEYALRRAGVSVLALGEEYRGGGLVETLGGIEARLPELRTKVLIGADGPPPAGWLRWETLQGEGAGAALQGRLARRQAALDPGDAAALLFTSGSTGQPKGACLSHRNILNNGRVSSENGLGINNLKKIEQIQ
jgi:fatty-acyl-CoA synthase